MMVVMSWAVNTQRGPDEKKKEMTAKVMRLRTTLGEC
jgi:hypothetical protein